MHRLRLNDRPQLDHLLLQAHPQLLLQTAFLEGHQQEVQSLPSLYHLQHLQVPSPSAGKSIVCQCRYYQVAFKERSLAIGSDASRERDSAESRRLKIAQGCLQDTDWSSKTPLGIEGDSSNTQGYGHTGDFRVHSEKASPWLPENFHPCQHYACLH